MRNIIKRIRSGNGSEIISVVTLITGLIMFFATVIMSGKYDAAVRAQIVTDAVVDGAVVYAKDDMEVSEKVFEKMAQKIFSANANIANSEGVASYSLGSMSLEPAINRFDLIPISKRGIIGNRARIITTPVTTVIFKLNKFGEHQWPNPNAWWTAAGNHYSYTASGPMYKDQIASVTVNSNIKIPFIGQVASYSITSSNLSVARTPYNARLDVGGVLRNGSLTELENCLYSEILGTASGPSDIIKRGTAPYYMLTAAKRYLGDGYANKEMSDNGWPRGTSPGEQWMSGWSSAPMNHYGHCFLFLEACAGEFGGISGAMARFGASTINRSISYSRNTSAKYLFNISHREKYSVMGDMLKDFPNPNYYKIYDYNVEPDRAEKFFVSALILDQNGKPTYMEITGLYSDPMNPGFEETPGNLDQIENHMRPYNVDYASPFSAGQLKAGDILIYMDPNKESSVQREHEAIKNAGSIHDAAITDLDNGDGMIVAHYAMFIGQGKVIESGPGDSIGNDGPQVNGLPISQIEGPFSGDSTRILGSVIRFSDNATPASFAIDEYMQTVKYNP